MMESALAETTEKAKERIIEKNLEELQYQIDALCKNFDALRDHIDPVVGPPIPHPVADNNNSDTPPMSELAGRLYHMTQQVANAAFTIYDTNARVEL
jgi:hypothetical protein